MPTPNTYTSPTGVYPCLPTQKPKSIIWMPTLNFGLPKGTAGRGAQTIKGIVIHCLNSSLAEYDNTVCQDYRLMRAKPKHPSLHYAVGKSGAIHQYVDDANVAWGLAAPIPNAPASCPVDWSLATANPGVNPDLYLLHIGLEAPSLAVPGSGQVGQGCATCKGATDLNDQGYARLINLIAHLADQYSIPLDADHIQFDQNIRPTCSEDECRCADLSCILTDADQYCETCDNPPLSNFVDGDVAILYGESESRCTTRRALHEVLKTHVRINAGVLEFYNDFTNTWEAA